MVSRKKLPRGFDYWIQWEKNRLGKEVRMDFVLAQAVNLNLTIGGIVALIAGILILMMPRLLNYIVAIYLIVIGLVQLLSL
jgi:hypothetical protein